MDTRKKLIRHGICPQCKSKIGCAVCSFAKLKNGRYVRDGIRCFVCGVTHCIEHSKVVRDANMNEP
jgi:hypothetical protein